MINEFFFLYHSGCTVNKTDESFFERFKQSEMLLRFINCTTDFTAANTTSTNCEDDEINGLYENLTQRLEKFEWCNSLASDIRNQVSIFQKIFLIF